MESTKRDPLIGAHMSIAGGLHRAVERALEVKCRTLQIFVKNASQWKGKPISEPEAELFRRAATSSRLYPLVAHDSYLINLAAPRGDIRSKSLAALCDELQRCERLGLSHLITHPGAHLGAGERVGIERIARAINRVHRGTGGFRVKVCLEVTAGQGSCLGYRFEQIGAVLDRVHLPERVSVCLDTCHLFAAGYDIRHQEGFLSMLEAFDRILGLERLAAIHVNDSKKGLGSRVDRHEHIGRGLLGEEAFRLILQERRLVGVPKILETPKDASNELDRMNLATLRRLAIADWGLPIRTASGSERPS